MNISLYIARRYLFSKKSHNAINIISLIAVGGIAIATLATVCVMSIFNGFHDIVYSSFSVFEPDLRITPQRGKVFDSTTADFQLLRDLPEIELISETLEESALIRNDGRQTPVVLKGVADNFPQLTQINDILYTEGYLLKDEVNNHAILGVGLASNLGVYINQRYPLDIYAPRRNVPVNMANPSSSFTQDYVYVSNIFIVGQAAYDESYMLVPLEMVRELFDYTTEVSALEIKVKENAQVRSVQKRIQSILGDNFLVKDRYQQQEAAFRMINIEKWITFLMLCFIILIAVFNVIGSLSMLIVDKRKDIDTLRNLGANNKTISRIFLFEGWMISALGGAIGIALGVALCLGQQYFGWLQLGNPGAFVVNTYPVVVEVSDLMLIFLAVLAIGFLSVLYPVRYLSRKWLNT